jgi:hypothetical protein
VTNEHDFTLTAYQAIIEKFIQRGYKISQYDEVVATARHLVLRHDVDFDLGLAVKMAEVEAEQGWPTTYYVLLRTEFYNIFSSDGLGSLKKLVALGHTVGLHFDASLYPADISQIQKMILKECAILESILDKPVKTFSFHRPNSELLDHGFEVEGLINVYEKKFIDEIAYCSDSRGEWRYGHPLNHPCLDKGHAMQLLTHPIWWTNAGKNPQTKCAILLDHRYDILDNEAAANCQSYTPRRPR